MTVPVEELRAIESTREFLIELMQPRGPWKKIGEIRERASRLLRHYPWPGHVKEAYKKAGRV